jgi:hypothetical protein
MYLLYLDASGTPEQQDRNSKHYVLVGLCMHEGSWFALDKRLQAVKRKYCLSGTDPDQLEIHVKQFAVTIKEQDEILDFEQLSQTDRRARVLELRRQKLAAETSPEKKEKRLARYKDTDSYVHLTRRERSQLLEDAIEVIAGYDTIRLFGEAIDKAHPAAVAGGVDLREQAFTQVVARFDKFLQKKDTWKRQSSPRGAINHGLLMLDQDASTQSVVEPLFKRFRQHGHPFGQMTHVIDVPFFGSSTKVGGLQLADVAAYVVRRYLDKGAPAGSHEERHFMQLFQRFDRDNHGKLHGLRHYVPANSCHCTICRERGHAVAPAPPAASPPPPLVH